MTLPTNLFDFKGMRPYPSIELNGNSAAFDGCWAERMERFCDELRGERERRRISIEKISQETKVSSRHLLALEAGEYSSLPGGVFRKGIVRSYLRALGMEETPWIERFESSLREAGSAENSDDWTEFAENVRRNRGGLKQRADIRWVGVAAMITALVALSWCVWQFLLHKRIF